MEPQPLSPIPVARLDVDPDGQAREVPLLAERFTPEQIAERELAEQVDLARVEANAEELARIQARQDADDAADPNNRAEWVGGPFDGAVSRPSPAEAGADTHAVPFLGLLHTYRRPDPRSARWYAVAEHEFDGTVAHVLPLETE